MSHVIHARRIKKKMLFRIWSTVSDSYLTEEMTEKELREYILADDVNKAIELYFREIDDRVQRVREKGTSSRIKHTHDLTAPWDKERRQ